MEQQLFSELRTLYSLSWGKSNVIRLRIRMRDLVDSDSLRYAVKTTMNRYPYFCVELKKAEEYYFAQNDRPVVITNSLSGVELNTAESNYHLVSFSWMNLNRLPLWINTVKNGDRKSEDFLISFLTPVQEESTLMPCP